VSRTLEIPRPLSFRAIILLRRFSEIVNRSRGAWRFRGRPGRARFWERRKAQSNSRHPRRSEASRVVIDGSQGGKDHANTDPQWLTEKDIVLDIALKLGRPLLEDRNGHAKFSIRAKDDTLFRSKIADHSRMSASGFVPSDPCKFLAASLRRGCRELLPELTDVQNRARPGRPRKTQAPRDRYSRSPEISSRKSL